MALVNTDSTAVLPSIAEVNFTNPNTIAPKCLRHHIVTS